MLGGMGPVQGFVGVVGVVLWWDLMAGWIVGRIEGSGREMFPVIVLHPSFGFKLVGRLKIGLVGGCVGL